MGEKLWLDSFLSTHKLPRTFSAAMNFANRKRHAADLGQPDPPQIIPYSDTMYILRHGTKAWRAAKAKGEI